jgi:outer membrane protein assembly factor BamB
LFIATGTPAPRWQTQHTNPLEKQQQFGDTVCYAETASRTIYGRDTETGSLKWMVTVPRALQVQNPEQIDFRYIVHEKTLFIGRYDGKVQAHRLP